MTAGSGWVTVVEEQGGATHSVDAELLGRLSVFALQSHPDDITDDITPVLGCHDNTLCTRSQRSCSEEPPKQQLQQGHVTHR